MGLKSILLLIGVLLVPLIVLHHRFIHRLDKDKSPLEKWFQWEDVNNHETVVMMIIGFIIGLLVCYLL
jgi:uncharacterized membrane protein YqhA